MERSEGPAKLAAAFTKAQAELPAVQMNTTNKFLGNRYADLGAVIENARPIPQKHGLSISQLVIGSGAAVGIETILRHSSGEYISNRVELELGAEKGKSAAQVPGSTISYLRRYAYAAAPGMYADEDTNGNAPRPTQDKQAGDKAVPAKQAGEAMMRRVTECGVAVGSNSGAAGYYICANDDERREVIAELRSRALGMPVRRPRPRRGRGRWEIRGIYNVTFVAPEI